MSLKRIAIDKIGALKKFHSGGGEGTIFITNNGKLIKLYDASTNEDIEKINKRLCILGADNSIFDGLSSFCAVPEMLIEQSNTGKIIGFQMNLFKEFSPLSVLVSKQFCVDHRITIRKIATVFLAIHDAISKIHSKGFIIGDLNYENIMFKFENKSVRLAFVDVDSWAIRKGNVDIPSTSITPTLCHPEIESGSVKVMRYHDWYSFAVILAHALIKDDPFNLGILDKAMMHSINGKRQQHGITCWDPRVTLRNEHIPYVRRFGKKITQELETWLKGDKKDIFPKGALEDFLAGLSMCKGERQGKKCALEVHLDHINCTRCGEKLTQPITRASHIPPITAQNPAPQSKRNQADMDLLDSILQASK